MRTREHPHRTPAGYDRPLKPEVLPKTDDPLMEWLVWLMDQSIRTGRFSFGLDGILGLIPGFGDLGGSVVSAFIVYRAARAGVPKAAVARMMANVAVDSVLGAIPFLGDLFDFLYKANTKNLKIYQEAIAGTRDTRRDWGFVFLVIVGVLGLLAIPLILIGVVIAALFR
ncbi:MAG: DUF4112 domain-containing protein [Bryobacteraceae bacterium]|nr:DUF4112 domain-containing protein [Bryobacterales bacterium]MEB2361324.1 DUF4112 domain-containing protein [Bryobacterales bacterium]NUN03486.1 DUF4112 domain-containing protein [Bryobacteraceae bacterium]